MKKIDNNLEVGKIYGDLKVIKFIKIQSNGKIYEVECLICGRKRNVWLKDIKRGIGNTHKNCIVTLPKNETTKKLRNIWSHIVDRCTNPNSEHYDSYGGRGITCEYKFFIDFYDDMAEEYIKHVEMYGEKNTTIERINVNGNYEKSNLKWETWDNQLKNKRWQKYKAVKDNKVLIGTAKELSEQIGCIRSSISECCSKSLGFVYGWQIFKIEDTEKENCEL